MLRVAPTAAFVLTLAGAPAMADTVLLPDVSVHLLAAHYAPVDTDFRWVGWIGAGAGLVEVGGVTAYFTGDVETIIGNTRRTFDANQANYHLEAGLRRRFGEQHEAAIVFSHVSRHVVDRVKVEAVDWNILGVRGAGRRAGRIPLAYTAGLGHTTLASLRSSQERTPRHTWPAMLASSPWSAPTRSRAGTSWTARPRVECAGGGVAAASRRSRRGSGATTSSSSDRAPGPVRCSGSG